MHGSCVQMFGRTIKASIAKDNGRAAEFIRRKVYKDKSRCYECGVCILCLEPVINQLNSTYSDDTYTIICTGSGSCNII